MQKIFIACLCLVATCNEMTGNTDYLRSEVESVTIYHSGALVSRNTELQLEPGIHELAFKNLSSKMVLNSLKVLNSEITVLNKSLSKKLSSEELAQLLDRRQLLSKQITLIESKFEDAGFISSVGDLQKMTSLYNNEMLNMKKELREVERKIAEAHVLEGIELDNEDAAILTLIVSVENRWTGQLRFNYVCGGIGWSPAYEVNAESSSDKTIEIKYLAKTMSQTGENWEMVAVHLSSSFPLQSPTRLPEPGSPWVLEGGNYHRNSELSESFDTNDEVLASPIEKLEGVDYVDIAIPSFLKVRTLDEKYSIKSNSTVFTFPIKTVTLETQYFYYGFPSIDPEVYLVAQVTDTDTLGFVDGVASITYGGNDVGKSVLKFGDSGDTLLLPIGKDNSVFMKRSEIADQKYFKTATIGKKQQVTMAFEFELKNNNPFPINFELVEQVPISQTKSASVVIELVSDGRFNSETGEVSWPFILQPEESLDKSLIFTIEMDANYRYHTGYKPITYNRMASPRFL